MELRELRAFVAVVEAGGLSAGARRLHVSQPALSQTVLSLERELGVALLVRSRKGAVPTDAGRTLLKEARAVLAQVDALLAAVGVHLAEGARALRLGVPLEIPTALLPAALVRLRAEWPEVQVRARHASTAAQTALLSAGELDVALVREVPAGDAVDTQLLLEEPMGVLVAARYGRDEGLVRLEQLSHCTWIGFAREEGPAWWDEIAAVLRGHGHPRPPADQPSPLIAAVKLAGVAAGAAFAFAPADWGRPLPEGVVWRPLAGQPLVRRTWAAWAATSRRRDLAALVAALEDAAGPLVRAGCVAEA